MRRAYYLLAWGVALLCPPAQAASFDELFNTVWKPTTSPSSDGEPTDKLFKEDGDYCVPYGQRHTDEFSFTNIAFTHGTKSSLIDLIVRAGTHVSTACGGVVAYGTAEIATNAGWEPTGSPPSPWGNSTYGYGYYEATMRPSCVQGEISSFFWIQAPSYGPLELDVEFPDPPGHVFNDVHWTIHPSGQTLDYNLGFNPCSATHRYGFLWTPGKIVFTVDGEAKQTFTDPTLTSTETGFVMANAWTGNPNWGGGPPATDAHNFYSRIRFISGATSIPSD
jgi:hypothetical protein